MVAEAVIGKDREILKILDLGCGTGNLTKFLSDKQNCSIVAVDIFIDMLHVAKKKLENVEFLSAAIEQLPY